MICSYNFINKQYEWVWRLIINKSLFCQFKQRLIKWMVNQQYLKMTERERNQYKPQKTYQQLKSIFKTSKECELKYFIQYCFYAAQQLEESKYSEKGISKIKQIATMKVIPTYMPCLIYEHLLQTFASIVQAFDQNDKELLDYQVKEIKQSVVSYMSRPNLKPERDYQSYYSLQITDNIYDLNLKEKLYFETLNYFDQLQKLFNQTKGKKNQKNSTKSKNNNQQKIKEKKQILKNRGTKVQSILQKVTNKKSKAELITEENQQKYFILWKGIEMNWVSEEKNL